MSTMIKEVYEAFKEAGASEEKAASAAEALAEYENRFDRVDKEIAEVKGRINLLQWMTGFNLALNVAILLMLISMGMK